MNSFTINIDSTSDQLFHVIRVSGEVRSGAQIETDLTWKQAINTARMLAKTKVVVFDLSELTYWDTKGITDIIGTVVEINKNELTKKRAGLISPKNSHLMRVAASKYKEVNDPQLTPSGSSLNDLEAKLAS